MKRIKRDLLETAALSLTVFLVLHFTVQNFRIDGPSMHPTLINEQHLIVSKVAYFRVNPSALLRFIPFTDKTYENFPLIASANFNYGDVIAFAYPPAPSLDVVKRVIGLPGDIIEIERGQVFRNGQMLSEAYVVNRDGHSADAIEVPPNSYFVLGDNRLASTDSRSWGFVPDDHIIGRAWLSYWPSDRLEFIHSLW